jgi:predicted nucleic acid-binding protein
MPDTNCMVALIREIHPHHQAALDELSARVQRGETMVIAAHCLAEAYSVLTRIPAPLQVSGPDAMAALEDSFIRQGEIVSLDAVEYLAFLRTAPEAGLTGGRIYDALIAACARKGSVDFLITFNERHFTLFQGNGLHIVIPAQSRN